MRKLGLWKNKSLTHWCSKLIYSKIEKGQHEASVEMFDKLAKFYGVSIDQIVHPDNKVPTEILVEDRSLIEQVKIINGIVNKDKT